MEFWVLYQEEMNKKYILGIDTSAYTTSIAVVSTEGEIVLNKKIILDVEKNQLGLRQQSAVFKHLNNLPKLFSSEEFDYRKIKEVAVSYAPRRVEGSYMPVFTVGKNFGKMISEILDVNYIEYSHQENHLSCAIKDYYKDYDYKNKKILAIHISGGTLEILIANKAKIGFKTDLVGGTKDITFGQLIDRIGVYCGYQFPCGIELEKAVEEADVDYDTAKKICPNISGDERINLSGIENYYKKLLDEKIYMEEIIFASIFMYISDCIIAMISHVEKHHGFEQIVISGGVSSNEIIRKELGKYFKDKYFLIFPNSGLSRDNAIGNAFLPIIDRWYDEN